MRSFWHIRRDEVIVHTSPDFLQRTFERLEGTLRPARDSGYDVSRIYLILDEILSNIYRHGYECRDGEPIGVQLRVQGNECVITARDLAPVFDSALHARTRVLPDPETGAPGGRGLVIVHRMCDSFEHSVSQEGGNVLQLVIKLIPRREPGDVERSVANAKETHR